MLSRPIRLAVVDNHTMMLRGLRGMAEDYPDEFVLVGEYTHVRDVELTGVPPDVVVLDLLLGRDDELSTPWIPGLVRWGARVLLHTSEESPIPLRAAVSAGASGMSLKSDGDESLRFAIQQVHDTGFAVSSVLAQALLSDDRLTPTLSEREVEVLQAIDDGLSHKQIARRLGIEISTVKTHLGKSCRKYQKLGRDVTNTLSVARQARQDGWFRG